MYVYLKESELNRKLFINKSYKHGVVKFLFSKDTPIHEIDDEYLSNYVFRSFPRILERSEEIPSYLQKKKEEKKVEPKPEPKVEAKPEPVEEKAAPVKEEPSDKNEDVTTPSQILTDLLKKKESE